MGSPQAVDVYWDVCDHVDCKMEIGKGCMAGWAQDLGAGGGPQQTLQPQPSALPAAVTGDAWVPLLLRAANI